MPRRLRGNALALFSLILRRSLCILLHQSLSIEWAIREMKTNGAQAGADNVTANPLTGEKSVPVNVPPPRKGQTTVCDLFPRTPITHDNILVDSCCFFLFWFLTLNRQSHRPLVEQTEKQTDKRCQKQKLLGGGNSGVNLLD